jgi:hypothetical protein
VVSRQPAESHAALMSVYAACIDASFVANNI